ncbi:MAG: hypothetical protein KBH39_06460 [Chitinophagales bacterium]|nr:hypothetical protein [Chitinophagales bacterium]
MTKQCALILLTVCNVFIATSQTPVELEKFISKFEKAVTAHKYNKELKLTDADYRAEQHDDFLSGNTKQFIDELFSGYEIQTDTFINFKLTDIDALTVQEVFQNSHTDYTMSWLVSSKKTGSAKCQLHITKKKNKWGVVGAVG